MLHLHIGSSMAYVEGSLPVGDDTQRFGPSSNAWFAMNFKRNDLPVEYLNYTKRMFIMHVSVATVIRK